MQLIEKFHQMESDNLLFELGKEVDLPLWDIIRYNVYIKYYYSKSDRARLETTSAHSIENYFLLIKQGIVFLTKILFGRGENIIFTASRYKNEKGENFDKSAISIIETLGNNCMIIEPVLEKRLAYPYCYDFSSVFRRFSGGSLFPLKDYDIINAALIDSLGENRISYQEVNRILLDFKSDYRFFKFLFSFKSTKKIFIATGNPKAQVLAANQLNISTYLIQHASIEFDEVDYSYPADISIDNRIIFPQYLFTFGNYWCRNLNVPAKEIIPIGNNFFYNKPKVLNDGSILIVSTIVHGGELRELTRELASLRKDLNFVFKLHPNEFHFCSEYIGFFKENSNVVVVTNEMDTNLLISKSQLIILIVSAVLYEAVNQNKKVAIYKKINYERQSPLANLANVYLFDFASEISDILQMKLEISDVDFFKPTDYDLIKKWIK